MGRIFLALAACFALAAPARADGVRYFHLDGLGNVRVVTNQAGDIVERHDYFPFGEECVTGPCSGNTPIGSGQPRHFTGKERDKETGLDYFGARYYASKIGRFTTVDPVYTWNENLLDPQRWNRYSYVRNNPFKYVDPDGRVIESPWDILNIGIGVVSFGANVAEGNVGAAAIDAAGVVVDVLAAAVPGVPGGAGTAIKAARAAGKIDSAIDAAKGVDFTADLGRTAAKSRSGHRYAGNKQLHEAMAADAAHRGQMEAKYGADAFDRTSTRGGGRRNPQGAEWDHNSTEPTALDLRSKESHLEKTKREGQAGGGWKRFHREQKE
jgi:RHS repeat-associated protein